MHDRLKQNRQREGSRLSKSLEASNLEGLNRRVHRVLDGARQRHLEVGGQKGHFVAGRFDEHVAQDGNRVLALDDLLEELQLNQDTETLKAIMRKSIPSTMQDVVLVFVTVSGLREGSLVQEVFARKIFAERADGHGRNFVRLLAQNQRLALLPEIAVQYALLRAQVENTVDVEIVSAIALTPADTEKFTHALTRRLNTLLRQPLSRGAFGPQLLSQCILRR